jgi:hypothetical protein
MKTIRFLLIFIIAFSPLLATFATVPTIQLRLSHIECVGSEVEVHFVLLNVPEGVSPGVLTYTYGTIQPGSHTGNVWHYVETLPGGYYNVTEASVWAGDVEVTLQNPGEYTGIYQCDPTGLTQVVITVSDQFQPLEGWSVRIWDGITEIFCKTPCNEVLPLSGGVTFQLTPSPWWKVEQPEIKVLTAPGESILVNFTAVRLQWHFLPLIRR